MRNLFVYGALMYNEVWNSIVVGKHEKISAQLPGYKRLKVKDEEYPGIVTGDGTVKGFIWFDVDDENISRLDNFEAKCYERVEEYAQDMNGQDIKVDVYRIRENYKTILEDVEWDIKHFEKSGLKKFILSYAGFKRE
jgi:gamma-glutamylcyclotransferase (GGCT)/AIG2-like uncharacterized protein YtfP